MFKELMKIFKKETLLDEALRQSQVMLRESQKMYLAAVKSLRHTNSGKLEIDIYEKDKEINRFEQEVRKKVLTHLAISDRGDLTAGLVLTSIIIDVERIGDYTKNIVELAMNHPKRLNAGLFEPELQDIETNVTNMFGEVIEAFENSDVGRACHIIATHRPTTRKCDAMISRILREEDTTLSAGRAVATALYIRYLKRIDSHLMNIATGIANPFHRIGFIGQDAET